MREPRMLADIGFRPTMEQEKEEDMVNIITQRRGEKWGFMTTSGHTQKKRKLGGMEEGDLVYGNGREKHDRRL